MGGLHTLFSRKNDTHPAIKVFIRKAKADEPDAVAEVVKAGAATVESLLPLVNREKDHPEALRRNAIRALGRLRDARAVEAIIPQLKDEDVLIRTEAADALGKLGDPRAVEPLIEALSDGYAVCSAAAHSLGQLGDRRAVEPLINMLSGGCCYECGKEAAAEALGHLGDSRAHLLLIQLLHDPDTSLRKTAANALAQTSWQPENDAMQAAYLVAQQDWHGCAGLGASAVPELIQAMRSPDFDIAWHAGNTLVLIGTPAVEPLRACLNSSNLEERADATRILEEIKRTAK